MFIIQQNCKHFVCDMVEVVMVEGGGGHFERCAKGSLRESDPLDAVHLQFLHRFYAAVFHHCHLPPALL